MKMADWCGSKNLRLMSDLLMRILMTSDRLKQDTNEKWQTEKRQQSTSRTIPKFIRNWTVGFRQRQDFQKGWNKLWWMKFRLFLYTIQMWANTNSKHIIRLKRRLFVRTNHNMRIFGVIPFIKLQNDTETTVKRWKIICRTRTLICFWLSHAVFVSSTWKK